jgi:hypothetical protein
MGMASVRVCTDHGELVRADEVTTLRAEDGNERASNHLSAVPGRLARHRQASRARSRCRTRILERLAAMGAQPAPSGRNHRSGKDRCQGHPRTTPTRRSLASAPHRGTSRRSAPGWASIRERGGYAPRKRQAPRLPLLVEVGMGNPAGNSGCRSRRVGGGHLRACRCRAHQCCAVLRRELPGDLVGRRSGDLRPSTGTSRERTLAGGGGGRHWEGGDLDAHQRQEANRTGSARHTIRAR